MRTIRKALALSAGAVLVVGLAAAPAWSQAEEEGEFTEEEVEHVIHEAEEIAEANGAGHADAVCIPILVEGGTIDDCREAPNPLLPETNEIIWGGIGFLIVFFALAKWGYPVIKKSMDERTERIRSQIDDAERQKAEAGAVLEQYQRQLNDAKAESGRIIEEARQAADAMRRDLQAKAEADAVAIRQRAQADVDQMISQARADLQTRVSELSIQLAEKVVGRNLDRDTNLAIIDSYIRELETQGQG